MAKYKLIFNHVCKHYVVFMIISIYLTILLITFFVRDYNTFRNVMIFTYLILWICEFIKFRIDRYIIEKNDIFNISINEVVADISNHNFDDYLEMKETIKKAKSIKNYSKYKDLVNEKLFELIEKNKLENYYDDIRKYKLKVI